MASVPESVDAARGSSDAEPALLLGGMVRVLHLDRVRDDRGTLTPMTFDELGFRVARTFVVNAGRDAVRGGHAHRRVRQVLFRASGTIEVEVRHGGGRARITLGEDQPALLIEPGVWAQQTYVGEASALIVFADGPYDSSEYDDEDPSAQVMPS